jgi:hypothetical protein
MQAAVIRHMAAHQVPSPKSIVVLVVVQPKRAQRARVWVVHVEVESCKAHALLADQRGQHSIQHAQRLNLALLLQRPNCKLRANLENM